MFLLFNFVALFTVIQYFISSTQSNHVSLLVLIIKSNEIITVVLCCYHANFLSYILPSTCSKHGAMLTLTIMSIEIIMINIFE